MMVNGDFTRVVEANFHERKRSSSAAKQDRAPTSATIMLQQVGFTMFLTCWAGFGGMRDPTGKISVPGWASSRLPVSNDNGEGASYQSPSA